MSRFHYEFDGEIVTRTVGKYTYTVVYLPEHLADELGMANRPRLRIVGEVAGMRWEGALQPAKGKWYLMLSKSTMKSLGRSLGDMIDVRFGIADQDAVEVPRELQFALDADGLAAETWNQLTPGKRRGLAYRVASAKTTETREKRVDEILTTLDELRNR